MSTIDVLTDAKIRYVSSRIMPVYREFEEFVKPAVLPKSAIKVIQDQLLNLDEAINGLTDSDNIIVDLDTDVGMNPFERAIKAKKSISARDDISIEQFDDIDFSNFKL